MRFFFNPLSGQINAGPPREIVYADTAPLYPQEGSRWFDTINLREYVYTGTEWVESGVGPAGVKGDTGEQGPVGPVGPIGATGPQGPAATIAVGAVTTGDPGTSVSVANSGTTSAAVLNFTIPRGAVGQTGAVGPQGPQGPQGVKGDVGNTGPQGVQGLKGDKGDTGAVGPVGPVGPQGIQGLKGDKGDTGATGLQGPAGTSVVLKGSVAQVLNLPTTGNTAGDLWVVTATGDGYVWSNTTNSWSNVGPIRGPVGATGATGAVGPAGTAATVSVGTTTTGVAGTNASVTNSGTTSAAVFNFTIPRGATGATGATGAVGPQGPQGIKGDTGNTGAQGPAGPAPAGTGAVVVSNGTLGTPVGYGTTNVVNTLVQRDTSGNFSAGTITANVTGNVSGSSSSCTGNAATATKLATTRAINVSGDVTGTAQNFDGSAAITIPTAISAGVIVNADINDAAAIADTKLATISTAGKVSNSATTATSANTVSAIVARDANGNFSATTITAALSGNATTASSAAKLTTARNINGVSFDGSADISISAAPIAHNHDASNITTGTLANALLPARLQAAAQTITDWNNALENGWYQGYSAANAPEGVLDWWLGYVEAHYDRWVTQTVHRFTGDAPTNTHIWRRSSADAGTAVRTWGPWYKLQLSQSEQDTRYALSGHTHTATPGVGGLFRCEFTNNIDANVNRPAGSYGSYSNSATNTPTTSGILHNFTSGADGSSDGSQIWQAYVTNRLYARQRWGGTWSAWTEISYVHPTTDGNLHVPVTGTTNNGKVLKAGSTAGSISWGTLTAADVGAATTSHTHSTATATVGVTPGVAGFMSAADKTKLDGVATSANNYVHPTTDGNLHVPVTGTTNNGKVLKAGSTAGSISWGTLTAADVGAATTSHTHSTATETADGFMSAADKTKLNGLSASAGEIPYTFSQIGDIADVRLVSLNATGNLLLVGKKYHASIYHVGELGLSVPASSSLQTIRRDTTDRSVVACKISANGDVVVLVYSYEVSSIAKNAVEVFELDRNNFDAVTLKSVFFREWTGSVGTFSLGINSFGNLIAVGIADMTTTKNNVGQVRVFNKFQYQWEDGGIYDGDAWSSTSQHSYTRFGWDVDYAASSLNSSSRRFIAGAPYLDSNFAGTTDGRVKVYSDSAATGVGPQVGDNINGEYGTGEQFGTSVSINGDGTVIAVGAPKYKVSGVTSGRVKIYYWNGSSWVSRGTIQGGASAAGTQGEEFGTRVLLNHAGNMLIASGPALQGSAYTKYVKIYKWTGGSTWQLQKVATQSRSFFTASGVNTAGLSISNGEYFGRVFSANASFDVIAVGYGAAGYPNDTYRCSVFRSAVKGVLNA